MSDSRTARSPTACMCTIQSRCSAAATNSPKCCGSISSWPFLWLLLYGVITAAVCPGYSSTPSTNTLMPGKLRLGTPSNCFTTLASTSRSAGRLLGLVIISAATWALSSPRSASARYNGSTPTVCAVALKSNSESPLPALAAASIQAVTPYWLLTLTASRAALSITSWLAAGIWLRTWSQRASAK
ncbi:hypothetical protein D9M71_486880 [compost metagenome]